MKTAMILVALSLGLLAVAGAAASATSQHLVLLEGANWPMPGLDSAAHISGGRSYRKHRHHSHKAHHKHDDDDDEEYKAYEKPDKKEEHEEEQYKYPGKPDNKPVSKDPSQLDALMECVQRAVAAFNADDKNTWVPAAKILGKCVAAHWDTCSDNDDLPRKWAETVPGYLLLHGVHALAEEGDLSHASAVLTFYLIGSQATLGTPPNTIANPWFTGTTPPACASKLAAMLHLGASTGNDALVKSLAKVVLQIIVEVYTKGPAVLGGCEGDVGAVLVSLASIYCPKSNALFNPLTATPIPCAGTGPLYAAGAGAQLAGSVISLAVLSDNPVVEQLVLATSFSGVRIALAAAQQPNFASCVGGGLAAALKAIPTRTPALAEPVIDPTADGVRTVCATIEAVRVGNGAAPNGAWTPVDSSLLFQGQVNVGNAITNAVIETDADVPVGEAMCAFGDQTLTFVDATGAVVDLNCLTVPGAPRCPLPAWLKVAPTLTPPNTFGPGSTTYTVCTA